MVIEKSKVMRNKTLLPPLHRFLLRSKEFKSDFNNSSFQDITINEVKGWKLQIQLSSQSNQEIHHKRTRLLETTANDS